MPEGKKVLKTKKQKQKTQTKKTPQNQETTTKNDGIISQGHRNQNEVTSTHQIKNNSTIKIIKDSNEL